MKQNSFAAVLILLGMTTVAIAQSNAPPVGENG